jgi:hypothetical protein
VTPIKILATIFAVAVLVKLIFLVINPNLWMKKIGGLLKNPLMTTAVYLGAATIVGYFVLTRISIIDVAAVMLFTSLLIGLGLAPYSSFLLKMGEEMINKGVGKAWLALVIWGALALWVLFAVLA